VGDIILDEYIWGTSRRISPEAPVPIVEVTSTTYRPGGATNVAANITSLGSHASVAGVVGQDRAADQLFHELSDCRINAAGIIRLAERPTTTKSRIISHQQQVLRLDMEERYHLSVDAEDQILDYVRQELPHSDACILSDYAKGVLSSRLSSAILECICQQGKLAIVDPNGTDYRIYEGANIVKPNLREAERLCGREIRNEDELIQAGQLLCSVLPETALLVTLGWDGMLLFRWGERPQRFAAQARHVYDVTGAGDTVIATLTLALAAGAPLDDAVRLANHAAGIAVGRLGAVAVTQDDLVLDSLPEFESHTIDAGRMPVRD
jgi:D-beta-D-heptose 7-phosphate kinase/D-beta-D-heptose 1-phosphate adenosyltransferase